MPPRVDRKATTNAKHWCEFCRTFIYNNKVSRDKHDASDWHRQSVQKFIERQQREEAQRQRLLGKFTAATGVKLGATGPPVHEKTSFYQQAKAKEEPLELLSMRSGTVKRKVAQVDEIPPPEATIGAWQTTSEDPAPKKPKELEVTEPVVLGPVRSEGRVKISLLKK